MRLHTALAVAFAVCVAGGCGGGAGRDGEATIWITRERGNHVLLVRQVPAGLTAMQALDRVADVRTRYGGRFVQSVNGIGGSATRQRDWFYFINGYEADRGAAEYRLRDGDVEWWDYRPWTPAGEPLVVVGAFPEPFLHGYDGKRRPTVVVVHGPMSRGARALARLVGARETFRSGVAGPKAPADANVLNIVPVAQPPKLIGGFIGKAGSAGDRVGFTYYGDPMRLVRNPRLFRFRYSAP